MAQPMKLSILIGADASGAKAGGAEAQRAIGGVTKAANDAGVAINRLIGESTGLNRAFASVDTRAQDIAAYGAQLDALRAKYNPVYAAIARYRAEVVAIRDAHRVGALGPQEMAAALSRERQATLASIDAIKGRKRELASMRAPSSNGGRFETSNIAAQFQDIAVTAAMGMDPLQIALQQGTQLSAVLGPMGAAGAARGLGAAFMSIVNPVSLATIGMVGLSAAAIQYFSSSSSGIKTNEALLDEHQEAIQRIRDLWGEAAVARSTYGRESTSSATFGLENTVDEMLKRLRSSIDKGDIGAEISSAINRNMDATGLSASQFRETPIFKSLKIDLDALHKSITTDPQAVIQLVQNLENVGRASTNNGLRKMATDAVAALKPFRDIAIAASGAREELRRLFEVVGSNGMLLSQGGINRNDAGNLALFLSQQRVAAERAQTAFDAQMLQSAARSPMEKAAAARAVAASQYSADETPAARSQRIELAGKQTLINAERELQRAQEDRGRSLQASVDAQQFELSIMGKSVAEQQRLRMEYQQIAALKAEAAQNGTTVDQREIELIRQKADEYSRLAQAIAGQNALRSSGDELDRLRLEISLVGQSAEVRARSIAAYEAEKTIRDQGIASSSRMADQLRSEAQERANLQLQLERQQAAYQATQQAGSTMIDQLVVGTGSLKDRLKSVAETLLTTFQQLAIANPLKNMLLGTNLPTLTDLFSGKSAASPIGATTTGSMTVTAATVMINGVPLGTGLNPASSLLGAANNNAPATAVNGVRPELLANGIVNTPVAANQNLPANLSTYAAAIRNIESGNNYSAVGPVTKSGDQAYGAYQIMGNNVPSWSQQALGRTMTPQQLLADPAAQDAIFADQMQRNFAKYGNINDTTSVWHSGRPLAQAQNAQDILGTKTPDYVSKVNAEMSRLSQTTSTTTEGLTSLNGSTKTLTGTLADVLGGTKLPASTPAAPATQASGLAAVLGGSKLPTTSPNFFPSAPTSGFNPLTLVKSIPLFGPLLGSLFGFADGGAFAGGSVIPFATGGVVTRPTLFPMSGGRTGLMGEAGPEAIMPLERGAGGRLGVRASMPRNARQGGELRLRYETSNTLNIYGTSDRELLAQAREGMSMQLEESEARMRNSMPDMIKEYGTDPWVRVSGR